MRNDRVIALPADDGRYGHVCELPKRVRQELEEFFVKTSSMTKKEVTVEGWDGPHMAEKLIDKAATTYIKDDRRSNAPQRLRRTRKRSENVRT